MKSKAQRSFVPRPEETVQRDFLQFVIYSHKSEVLCKSHCSGIEKKPCTLMKLEFRSGDSNRMEVLTFPFCSWLDADVSLGCTGFADAVSADCLGFFCFFLAQLFHQKLFAFT